MIAKDLPKAVKGSTELTASQCNQRWIRVVNYLIRDEKQSENEMPTIAMRNSPHHKWQVIADRMIGRTDI